MGEETQHTRDEEAGSNIITIIPCYTEIVAGP